MNFILPLISFAGIIWDNIMKGIYFGCMLIEGVFYQLVAYSFRVFQLMCGINMNAVSQISEPLVNRLQSVVIVFVVYLLGISFIQFMLEPEKAIEGGKKILINLFIATALFISYNTIFSVFNELNIALMGNPSGYKYTTLGEWFDITEADGNGEEDNGLIIRFVFGETKIKDPGQSIALSVAGLFLRDSDNGGNTRLINAVCNNDGTCNFEKLRNNVPEKIVKKEITFTPFLGIVVACFIIYSMFTNAMQVAVRMFKLMIMQLLAPIVIVDVIKNGVKEGKFKNYCTKYLSLFIEAFVRMLTILVISVFVSQFLVHLPSYFSALSGNEKWYTTMILKIIVVIAAYTFAGQVPKFIDEVIGTHMGDAAKGNVLGSVFGGVAGALGGFGAGFASSFVAGKGIKGIAKGVAKGLGGGLTGMTGGAVRGAASGSKGEKISDFFKNNAEVQTKNREKARQIARQGGTLSYLGHNLEHALGIPQGQQARLDRVSDTEKAYDNMIAARQDALKDEKFTYTDVHTGKTQEVKFGSSSDEFASTILEYDSDVAQAQANYENIKKTNPTDVKKIAEAQEQYLKIRKAKKDHYEEEYNKALFGNTNVNKDQSVLEATSVYDKRADSDKTSKAIGSAPDITEAMKKAKKKGDESYGGQRQAIENKGALRRENRQGKY